MPMTVHGQLAYYTKSKEKRRGKDRKGIRAKDLMKQLTGSGLSQSPMAEKDVRLIEGISIVGADDLTARDQALYEMMLAVARDRGMEKDFHQIDVADVWSYLHAGTGEPDRRLERLQDSLLRLTRTVVRYTHRDKYNRTYGAMSLISAEIHENLATANAILDFTIPPAVRYAVMSRKRYTWLEVNAFAGFKSRYAARLYQHLAIRAGMDGPAGKRWEITPLELATMLNYPVDDRKGKGLHFASFRRRCLQPAMEDIAREVKRFTATVKEIPGKGRGRPIQLAFYVSPAERRFEELKAADVDVRFANHQRTNERHPQEELPSRLAIGRAVTLTGHNPEALFEGWMYALDLAKADPRGECAPGFESSVLLRVLRDNADEAFGMWAFIVKRLGRVPEKAKPAPLLPAAPEELKEDLRFIVTRVAQAELKAFYGRLLGRHLDGAKDPVGLMEDILRSILEDGELPLVVRADEALGGKVFAACRHAARNGLRHVDWVAGVALLSAGRPNEALTKLDELLSSETRPAAPPISSPALSARALLRPVPPLSVVAAETDILDDLDEMTGYSEEDDIEPPENFFETLRRTGEFSDEIPF